MTDIAVKIENLSKQYRLGEIGTGTLSHDLNRWFAKIRGKEDPTLQIGASNKLNIVEGDYVWALQNINLEVKKGEVLGIIGKNGAGKSTLLKILSRVTGPTIGSIKLNGRIASLLEVGTGFHPELTGSENIYLNGAILGMTKQEISKKFEEIVEFSGVSKYIDTPVKRYSSGMRVRLGFAVAAFLEPEILVVDEVLAVGDVEFQKRAIGKMQDVSQGEGRTVLFVSHNMASIKELCSKAILLKNGEVASLDDPDSIVSMYLSEEGSNYSTMYQSDIKNYEGGLFIKKFIIESNIKTGYPFEFSVFIISNIDSEVEFSVGFRNLDSSPALQLYSGHTGTTFKLSKGENLIRGKLPKLPLVSGDYLVSFWLGSNQIAYDYQKSALKINVEEGSIIQNEKKVSVPRGYSVIAEVLWSKPTLMKKTND